MNILVDCVQTGDFIIRALHDKIDYVITIPPKFAKEKNLSGYVNHKLLCDRFKIPIYYPKKFDLSSNEELAFFLDKKPDLLMVFGWQRIVPDKILNLCKVAVGNHGSWKKLPKGRGHSPINWELIFGKKKHYSHLFYLEPGVDSGRIIDYKKFKINKFDTCDSLYKKNAVWLAYMLKKNWNNILNKESGKKQWGIATYLPKRTPEDGKIDFGAMNTADIYNLVRGITKPYPGTFFYEKDKKIIIWKCQPFDMDFEKKDIGKKVLTFYDNSFVLATKDGSLLITEWEFE